MAAGEPEDALPMKPDIVEVEPGVFSVLDGSHSYEIRLDGDQAHCAGWTIAVDDGEPSNKRGVGSSKISSPMPGKVIRLLVQDGDTVEAGQGLLVVEAMKMQNEMKAPRAGVVRQLRAAAGGTVAAGEVIAVIE
jgi:biotin carboxyl carrier protein